MNWTELNFVQSYNAVYIKGLSTWSLQDIWAKITKFYFKNVQGFVSLLKEVCISFDKGFLKIIIIIQSVFNLIKSHMEIEFYKYFFYIRFHSITNYIQLFKNFNFLQLTGMLVFYYYWKYFITFFRTMILFIVIMYSLKHTYRYNMNLELAQLLANKT